MLPACKKAPQGRKPLYSDELIIALAVYQHLSVVEGVGLVTKRKQNMLPNGQREGRLLQAHRTSEFRAKEGRIA